MKNANTAPVDGVERIELPNGCYWQAVNKYSGYVYDPRGRYLTDVIGRTEANSLAAAMSAPVSVSAGAGGDGGRSLA